MTRTATGGKGNYGIEGNTEGPDDLIPRQGTSEMYPWENEMTKDRLVRYLSMTVSMKGGGLGFRCLAT